jgi:hypothetical protein
MADRLNRHARLRWPRRLDRIDEMKLASPCKEFLGVARNNPAMTKTKTHPDLLEIAAMRARWKRGTHGRSHQRNFRPLAPEGQSGSARRTTQSPRWRREGLLLLADRQYRSRAFFAAGIDLESGKGGAGAVWIVQQRSRFGRRCKMG